MNIYKTPTPEEINEAIKHLIKTSDRKITIGEEYPFASGFRDAISWFQNYQTQQQGAVRSVEEIFKEYGINLSDYSERIDMRFKMAINEYTSQFQTPASGTTDTRSKEQTPHSGGSASEMESVEQAADTQHCKTINSEEKALEEAKKDFWNFKYSDYGFSTSDVEFDSLDSDVVDIIFGAGWEEHAKWQSSQPQPNAISIEIIEAYNSVVDDMLPAGNVTMDDKVKVLEHVLTKLKKQL